MGCNRDPLLSAEKGDMYFCWGGGGTWSTAPYAFDENIVSVKVLGSLGAVA